MDMSDEIVDEGESIFATETINKQSSVKKSKMSSMRSEHSVMSEDLSVSDGTETRNKHAEIFGSDEDDESEMFSRGTKGKMSSNIKNKKDAKKRPKEEDSDEDEWFSENEYLIKLAKLYLNHLFHKQHWVISSVSIIIWN